MLASGTADTLADAAQWGAAMLDRVHANPDLCWVEAAPATPAGAGEWVAAGSASWVGVFTGPVITAWVPTDSANEQDRR